MPTGVPATAQTAGQVGPRLIDSASVQCTPCADRAWLRWLDHTHLSNPLCPLGDIVLLAGLPMGFYRMLGDVATPVRSRERVLIFIAQDIFSVAQCLCHSIQQRPLPLACALRGTSCDHYSGACRCRACCKPLSSSLQHTRSMLDSVEWHKIELRQVQCSHDSPSCCLSSTAPHSSIIWLPCGLPNGHPSTQPSALS